MTVQNTTAKVREDGNAVKSVFSFPFKVFSDSDIQVSTIVKSTGVRNGCLFLGGILAKIS